MPSTKAAQEKARAKSEKKTSTCTKTMRLQVKDRDKINKMCTKNGLTQAQLMTQLLSTFESLERACKKAKLSKPEALKLVANHQVTA